MENCIFYLNIYDIKSIDDELKSLFPKRYENAKRFRFEEDRLRSLSAGYLLAKVLNIDENDILFGENAKPYVINKPYFNLSHSGDYAILAISDAPVGIDIEKINPSHIDIAENVFANDELLYIDGNVERFFTLWTLKEATLKAVGKGMTMNLKSFAVLPLLNGNSINFENTTLFGHSYIKDDYAISFVSSINTAPSFKQITIF